MAAASRLHDPRERRATGRTLVEGPHLLEAAVSAGIRPLEVYALPEDEASRALARLHSLELTLVRPDALRRLAGTGTPRGPIGVIGIPGPGEPVGPGMVVAWGVADPGNVGTLIRTAAAFGWGFGHTPGTADPWGPKALRAGAGGHFAIAMVPVPSLEMLESAGLTTLASVVSGGVEPSQLGPGTYALLVGEEAPGLPDEVVESSGLRVTIPMSGGIESLNAAMAAGMIVYELSKPGRQAPGRV